MISAVIVAGGKGKRMGNDINKQYIKIGGKEILARTIETFNAIEDIDEIIVVSPEEEIQYCLDNIINCYGFKKVKKVVKGGKERQNSVYNGLKSCSDNTDIVIIHDGARPFVSKEIILRSINEARENGACAVAVPMKDTVKIVDEKQFVIDTPDRSRLYAVQTPQTFKYEIIVSAHNKALNERIEATDDTKLIECIGGKVKIIEGSYLNIKITTPEDLIFAEAIIKNMK
ncbi:2-C-methyl-D-erythritol 4-phosphate cytidylyltransferase [Fervidicella metallireducens AeB]|uniref:2-C-methyl-D-erythritol 4-phosphate cytidylyltransferase n=1 Tax=Fervidicella metallireducens AeB TaxID=1403537 RepID=A0A017RT26_9CLOT|nr:2-C-methyl-D-erythritol 4-phosphate cytidylyltransferase [Fervidicella metallireducens]EYE87584.1 2-C-methyl-D-erythritol 4-phosphate cytidylyltransferase [Fervidicella metallireducens AeB]